MINILLVEDNLGDVRLTRESLKECKCKHTLNVVNDGENALKFLKKEGEYANAICPDLILLDLNLPGIKGPEVLRAIKSDASLKLIPTIILTASQAEKDIIISYDAHANCYVCKPLDLDRFISVVQSVISYWSSIAKLPPKEHHGS